MTKFEKLAMRALENTLRDQAEKLIAIHEVMPDGIGSVPPLRSKTEEWDMDIYDENGDAWPLADRLESVIGVIRHTVNILDAASD